MSYDPDKGYPISDEEDKKLAAWIVACCAVGALLAVFVPMIWRACTP